MTREMELVELMYATGVETDWRRMLAVAKRARHPSACFVLITPECATELLRYNSHNRSPSATAAGSYSDTMSNNEWLIAHGILLGYAEDVLDVEEAFRIIDGQNRLNALRAAGKAVVMLVMFGLPAKTAAVVDTGERRSTAQGFAMDRVDGDPKKHIARTFALVKQVVDILHDGCYTKLKGQGELRRWYAPVKESVDWAVRTFSATKPLNNSCIAGTLAVAHMFYPAEVEALGAKLVDLARTTGLLNIPPTDPARDFIRKLMYLKNKKGGFGSGSRDRGHVVRLFFNGLRAYVNGRSVKKPLDDESGRDGLLFFSTRLNAIDELSRLKSARDVLVKKAKESSRDFAAKSGNLRRIAAEVEAEASDASRSAVSGWLAEHTDYTEPNRDSSVTSIEQAFKDFAANCPDVSFSSFKRNLQQMGIRGKAGRSGGLPLSIKTNSANV